MNSFHIAYAAWLAGIFILSRPDRAAWVVLANMTATLAVCGLMDIDAMSDAGSRMAMMAIDTASAAVLVTRAGVSRVLAALFAVSSGLHIPYLVFGVSPSTTFAVVYIVNVAQLAVLTIGIFSDGGGGKFRFRHIRDRNSLEASGLPSGVAAVSVAVAFGRGDR